jgi:predicted N-acetyltransferase YhbS
MSRRMDSIPAHECHIKGVPMATRTARTVASSSSLLHSQRTAARSAPSHLLTPLAASSAITAPRLRLAMAKTGDHPLIHGLLVSIFHGPTLSEFQSQLDEPGYEPVDRLIVKEGEEIAAHLRLARQKIQVGAATLTAARFMDLATATEYRSRGLATALLAAGERAAAERGVLVGLTRTRVPAIFARLGWSVCGSHVFSTASPQAVLAELAAAAQAENGEQASIFDRPRAEPIIVRPLRRIDLRAIVRLYDQHIAGKAGWPLRSEGYWEWLLARGACQQVYVASNSPETADFDELLASIVGYVCVRQSRIVELITAPGRDDVARHLVERVCADAREQDGWLVRHDAPATDAAHDLFRRAGGRLNITQQAGGELFMAKLLDPLAALRQLSVNLAENSAQAGVTRPTELGIELRCGGGRKTSASGVVERFRVHLSGKATHIETGGPSKHSIVLAYSDLAPLLLGDVSAAAMLDGRRMKCTTRKARLLASGLFPGGSWWRPPLDDLLA